MVALPPAWQKLRPHYGQSQLLRSKARFKACDSGRGSGKTAVARMNIVRMLPVRKPWTDPQYFWGMPTFKQAKRVAWIEIKKLIPRHWIAHESAGDMRITTVFGSSLYVVGLDKPETQIEGGQWDGGVLDENCDLKEGVFWRSVLPALSHRNGWCWRIGICKRYGQGANDFREFCELGRSGACVEGTNDKVEHYNWPSSTVLTEEQLAFYKAYMDERDYAEQIDAQWQSLGGAIFHAFNEAVHVRDDVNYNPNLPICVSSDFNVNPMCWILGHIIDGKLHVFDEIFSRNTNTPKTLDYLWERYNSHTAGFEFYGDATSRARKSSAVFTDYAHISKDDRFDTYLKKKIYYLPSNPAIADRFSSCNSLLFNASQTVRCFIAPRCKWLIKDLKRRSYKENSREPDDSGDIGHMSDAFGYLVHRRFPVNIKINMGTPKVSLATIPRFSLSV